MLFIHLLLFFSFVAVGGRHDFLEDEEDRRLNQRKSTPVSVTDLLEQKQEKGKDNFAPSDAQDKPKQTSPTNGTPSELSNEQKVPNDSPLSVVRC